MNRELAQLTTAVNMRFGHNVKVVMADKGITQRALAPEMAVTQTGVFDRLNGRHRWWAPEVLWLPRYLDVPLEQLLE